MKELRADIEALRAISVLSVLIFHLNPSWLPGGYIGVDAFFVISGYLISKSLVASIQTEQFSFSTFYLRRVRRLMPALSLTVFFSTLIAFSLFTAADLVTMSESAAFSLVGFGNVYFYATVDYFNNTSLVHPLLHTWSLGVEEQFYFVWPLILYFVHNNFQRLKISKTLCLTALLAPVLILYDWDPEAAFYLMPFRAFQFFIGYWAVDIENLFYKKSKQVSNFMTVLSLLGFASALIFFSESFQWPGVFTLVPSLSIVGVIAFSKQSLFYRFFQNGLFSFFGKISYSLYLVHWPVIVFYSYYLVVSPSNFELGALGLLSVVLGALLYEVSEAPFTTKSTKASKLIFLSRLKTREILVFLMALLLGSVFTIYKQGFPGRHAKVTVSDGTDLSFAGDICSSAESKCVIGDVSSDKNVYLIGDSYALNLLYGLNELFLEENIKLTVLYDHGCLYLKNTKTYYKASLDKKCMKNVEFAFKAVRRTTDPVIWVVNWDGYIEKVGQSFKDLKAYSKWLEDHLQSSLDYIGSNKSVLLFASSYITGPDLSRCLISGASSKRCKPYSLKQNLEKFKPLDEVIRRIASSNKISMLDPKKGFCSSESCKLVSDQNKLFFRDTAHLTNEGSSFLIRNLSPEILRFSREKGSKR